MKTNIILFCCLCSSLAVRVKNETTEKASGRYYKTSLKDIRLVPVKSSENIQEFGFMKEQDDTLKQTTPLQYKVTKQRQRKSEAERQKVEATSRSNNGDSLGSSSNEQAQMQKIANQLYLAQKRASLLSDYQKYIISQDTNVKNFVFGQSTESRIPKPFAKLRTSGRSLSGQPEFKYITVDLTTARNADSGKYEVVTSKIQTAPEKISIQKNDPKALGTQIKYVTIAPQPVTHFVRTHESNRKVTLSPYHGPQIYTFYDSEKVNEPQVQTVQSPTTGSLGIGSYTYQQPQYHHAENGHDEESQNDDAKYEFMYKVKDHEKASHYGHKESREDKTTYGYYFVQLPDGRLETVKYWADKTGFHAKVDYVGEAKHPPPTGDHLNSRNSLQG